MSDKSQFIPFLLGVVVGGVFTAYCKIYYKNDNYVKVYGDGSVSINGVDQGKYTESNTGKHIFNVIVNGNPDKVETMGIVVVNGNCNHVKTLGDVYITGKIIDKNI